MSVKHGDFQTPPALATAVVHRILPLAPWTRVIEPTCGQGALLQAFIEKFPSVELHAFDVLQHYVDECRFALPEHAARIEKRNALQVDLDALQWNTDGPLLVLANPPWVNVGKRARKTTTVDVATEIILRLVAYASKLTVPTTFAVLCKTSSSRQILELAGVPLTNMAVCAFNTQEHFGVSVPACLCMFTVNGSAPVTYRCPVYATLSDNEPVRVQGWMLGLFLNDLDIYETCKNVDGCCHFQWYIGMNGTAHVGKHTYPLLSGTDIIHDRPPSAQIALYKEPPAHYRAPFKIVISSMHKTLVFRIYCGSCIPDSTCYFLPFTERENADACLALLESALCKRFLSAVCFADNMSVVTQAVLQRISIAELARSAGVAEHSETIAKWRKVSS